MRGELVPAIRPVYNHHHILRTQHMGPRVTLSTLKSRPRPANRDDDDWKDNGVKTARGVGCALLIVIPCYVIVGYFLWRHFHK
jgi:hypothetical protein